MTDTYREREREKGNKEYITEKVKEQTKERARERESDPCQMASNEACVCLPTFTLL